MSLGAVRVEDGHSQGILRLSPQDGQQRRAVWRPGPPRPCSVPAQVPGSPVPPYTSLRLHRSHSLIVRFEQAPRLGVAGVGPAVFEVLTRLPNGPSGGLPGSAALAASLPHRCENRPPHPCTGAFMPQSIFRSLWVIFFSTKTQQPLPQLEASRLQARLTRTLWSCDRYLPQCVTVLCYDGNDLSDLKVSELLRQTVLSFGRSGFFHSLLKPTRTSPGGWK